MDLTNNVDRVASIHETIPVKAGELTLLYARWIPGEHSPTGPISKIAGLNVTAGGKRLPWLRDPVDVFAFHVNVPAGVSSIDVDFQYLSPVRRREGRIAVSNEIADLAWNTALLYPAGHYIAADSFRAQLEASRRLEVRLCPRSRLAERQ